MLRVVATGVTLTVRAQPGAKKTAITGVYGEGDAAQLKIAVHAPPIEGRANQALIKFLELSRSKVFLVRGVTRGQIERIVALFSSRP